MFLNELNKEEAIGFLNLVSIFVKVDNRFTKEEEKILEAYKQELGIFNNDECRDYNEIIDIFLKSSNKSKNIAYFELVSLALADGEYEIHEVDFLEKIAEELKIERSKKIAIANYFYKYADGDKLSNENKDVNLLREEAEKIIG